MTGPSPDDVEAFCRWYMRNKRIYGLLWRGEPDVLSAAIEGAYRGLKRWDPDRGAWTTAVTPTIRDAVRAQRIFDAGGKSAVENQVTFTSFNGGGPVDEQIEWFTPVDVEPVLALMTAREQTMCTNQASEAAEKLGIKKQSVRRQRVRIYSKMRDQLGVAV